MQMKKALKRAVSLCAALVCLSSAMITASASEPYYSYSYDNWDDAIPAQAGYKVEDTYTGHDIGLDRLKDPTDPLYVNINASAELNGPKDMFYENTKQEFWIADTKNSRIIRLDKDLELIGCYTGVYGAPSGTYNFNEPQGVFVVASDDGKLYMYVGDTQNSRVVQCEVTSETECECALEVTRPDSPIYTYNTFLPEKILVDIAGNIYAVCTSVNSGSAQFNNLGEFQGFYGANRVELTGEIIRRRIRRVFASDEQLKSMESAAPVEYKNFDIDEEGFIYTVTEAANTTTDAVKKLNAAGYNIWNNDAGNEYTFADSGANTYDASTNTTYTTRLTDIDIDDYGFINILDYVTGRVFVYDEFCDLITIFGTSNTNSDQKGSFTGPNALECAFGNVYIIDGIKNDITVYSTTLYGEYLKQAVQLYDEGKYVEAKPLWQEVLNRNGTCTFAQMGLGKACLSEGEYKEAMEYFKDAYARKSYDKAFKYYREQWLQDNFLWLFIAVALLLILFVVLSVLKKKGIIKKRVRKQKKQVERKKTKKELEHEAQLAAEAAEQAAKEEAENAASQETNETDEKGEDKNV